MVNIIREDQFERCFEMVMSLWPQDCRVGLQESKYVAELGYRESYSLYLDIQQEVMDHMEDGDRRFLQGVQYGVFEVVSILCRTTSVKSVSRDCIDKKFGRYLTSHHAGRWCSQKGVRSTFFTIKENNMCKQWTAVFSFVALVFSLVSAFSASKALAENHYTHFY